jgi:hypothetical protein
MTSCVASGQDAEKQLIEFHDQYICTAMLNPYHDYVTPDQDMPKRTLPMIKTVTEVFETIEVGQRVDTEDLIVCLQRHTIKFVVVIGCAGSVSKILLLGKRSLVS